MKKLTSLIAGAFLLAGVTGVAKAGDTIELTAAQMDDVTAGYYSVQSYAYADGNFDGHGFLVAGATESAAVTIAADRYYGSFSASGAINSTIASAAFGSIYGSSYARAGSCVGYCY